MWQQHLHCYGFQDWNRKLQCNPKSHAYTIEHQVLMDPSDVCRCTLYQPGVTSNGIVLWLGTQIRGCRFVAILVVLPSGGCRDLINKTRSCPHSMKQLWTTDSESYSLRIQHRVMWSLHCFGLLRGRVVSFWFKTAQTHCLQLRAAWRHWVMGAGPRCLT